MPLEKADVKYFSYHFRKCWNFNVALLHSFQVLPKSWSTLFKLLMQFWENGKWKRSQCSHSLRGSAIHFRNGKSNIQWQVCGYRAIPSTIKFNFQWTCSKWTIWDPEQFISRSVPLVGWRTSHWCLKETTQWVGWGHRGTRRGSRTQIHCWLQLHRRNEAWLPLLVALDF